MEGKRKTGLEQIDINWGEVSASCIYVGKWQLWEMRKSANG